MRNRWGECPPLVRGVWRQDVLNSRSIFDWNLFRREISSQSSFWNTDRSEWSNKVPNCIQGVNEAMPMLTRTHVSSILWKVKLPFRTPKRTLKLKQPLEQAKIEHVLKSDVIFLQNRIIITRVQILKPRIPWKTFDTYVVVCRVCDPELESFDAFFS